MLLYFGLSSAFFLFENKLNLYVHATNKTVTLSNINNASELMLEKSQAAEPYYVISVPDQKVVFDQAGGGNRLITWGMHGKYNQQFMIILTADDDFVVTDVINGNDVNKAELYCLNYDGTANEFTRVACSGNHSTFDILYEISYSDTPQLAPAAYPVKMYKNRYTGDLHSWYKKRDDIIQNEYDYSSSSSSSALIRDDVFNFYRHMRDEHFPEDHSPILA